MATQNIDWNKLLDLAVQWEKEGADEGWIYTEGYERQKPKFLNLANLDRQITTGILSIFQF